LNYPGPILLLSGDAAIVNFKVFGLNRQDWNPRSTTLEANTLTVTQPMRFSIQENVLMAIEIVLRFSLSFSKLENVLMAIEIVLRFSLSFSKLENEQNQEQNELLYY
jgi:hypothetical protein